MQKQYKQVSEFCYDVDSTPLGAGAFGRVYKGYDTSNNDAPVAIKVIPASILEQYKEHMNLFINEINVLNYIKGDYILEFKKVLKTGSGNLYIVTNFCNGGSLEGAIGKDKKMPLQKALKITKEITLAFLGVEKLSLLDSKDKKLSMIHRDIKPANILFHDGSTRLADFGFSKLIEDSTKGVKSAHTQLGTPYYMSPQLLATKPYSYKCDIWAAGIVLYEMIFGRRPWNAGTQFALERKIKSSPLEFPSEVSKEVKDLLHKMLAFEEDDRIDWRGIISHPAMELVKETKPEVNQPRREVEETKQEVKKTQQEVKETKQEVKKTRPKIRIIEK